MPRVRFSGVFNWHPRHNVTIRYEANREYPVTRRCAEEAVAKGKGAIVERERKDDGDAGR